MHPVGIDRLGQQYIVVHHQRHTVGAAQIANAAQFFEVAQLEFFVAVLHEAGAALQRGADLIQCGEVCCPVVGYEVKAQRAGQS